MRTRSVVIASLVALAGVNNAGAAGVEVSASARDFRYQLIDLAPEDGVDPWIRFEWLASPKASLFHDPAWSSEYAQNMNRDFEPVFLQNGPDMIRGQVTPEFVELDLSIQNGSAHVYMEHIASYSVSPNTRFVFTAAAAVDSAVEPGAYATTWAGLAGMFMAAPDSIPVSFEGGGLSTPSGPAAGTVSVSAASGELAGSGVLFMTAYASASSVSPIPEPGKMGMLGAGLLLLAVRCGGKRSGDLIWIKPRGIKTSNAGLPQRKGQ